MERDSPWGALGVSDAHVHFFSRKLFDALAAMKGGADAQAIGARLGWQLPESTEALASAWVKELDHHRVARAALIASVPGDEESVVAAAAAHPGRFFTYSMVDPVKCWLPEKFGKIQVICLFPAMHRYSVHSGEGKRAFEWAAAHHRAVFVHCGVLSVGVRKKLGIESRFDMRFSNPIDLHGIALEFPTVPIIIPHFGAGYFREALMLADQCANVYLDTSSSNGWMRYQESHLDLRQVFKRALDVAGPKRLLFGTDSSFFPRGWQAQIFDQQATALYELGVSHADARLIFEENLLRIIGA